MRYFIGTIFALILTCINATARPLTASEFGTLNAIVEKFISDMEQLDMVGVTDVMPARIINHYSGIVEMSPDGFRGMMATQMENVMASVSDISINIELTDLDATDAQNTDGSAAIYAVVPNNISLTINDKPVKATSALLALHEAGAWGLIRIDPSQREQLIAIYPFLKDTTF